MDMDSQDYKKGKVHCSGPDEVIVIDPDDCDVIDPDDCDALDLLPSDRHKTNPVESELHSIKGQSVNQ
jgi:hypothetical protein